MTIPRPDGQTSALAVITGTSSGIGAQIAGEWLDAGGEVVGVSRRLPSPALMDRDRYRHIRGDLRQANVRADVLRAAKCIHALVLNAGVCEPTPLQSSAADTALWDRMLDINLNAPAALLREAQPWLEPGAGVVAISSTLGLRGRAGYGAYCASKHGLLGLVRAAALELAPRGIRVNAVCPGWTDTAMAQRDLGRLHEDVERGRREEEAQLPLRRFVTPSEVASAVLFLLSASASTITGQTLEVSSGQGVG